MLHLLALKRNSLKSKQLLKTNYLKEPINSSIILRHVDYLDGRVKEASAKSTFSKIAIREEVKTFFGRACEPKIEINYGILINIDPLQNNFVGFLSSM